MIYQRGATSINDDQQSLSHFSSIKELHDKGCLPENYVLFSIIYHQPNFTITYYSFATTTSSLLADTCYFLINCSLYTFFSILSRFFRIICGKISQKSHQSLQTDRINHHLRYNLLYKSLTAYLFSTSRLIGLVGYLAISKNIYFTIL